MKITVEELKKIVREALEEAKKNESQFSTSVPETQLTHTVTHGTDPKFDFSKPLGDANLYKQQGASNFGPYTEEKALRMLVRQMISESLGPVGGQQLPLGCQHIFSHTKGKDIWENAGAMLEASCQKCGMKMTEAHIGFKKLKNKLAHKKGIKNPAALAASIGRKKYGAAGMAKKAAAGKK